MTNDSTDDAFAEIVKAIGKIDYYHVKTVESPATLREFVTNCLAYMPGWMRFLYRVREYFVLMLGTRQDEIPRQLPMSPQDLSFTPGDPGSFFTVLAGKENLYWLGEAKDDMIAGCLGMVCEPTQHGTNRFHVVTTATYLRWTARIYFNVIRPFHHLVIHCMTRHALKQLPE
ncbi:MULTISPECIES: DUF2867 domain-containing protein [unclassified Pseudodesulfovibrio]|uniref:DUF2867 domain-containing protein n=1 Tax=unclassified Pseudodesulfovibrio TaxID=2661612 RepID=UPI000FEB923D|nr:MULTISPECIES: DUF2867 domain-containing protein [unclassified Pseudodesulfovibrio]MCJ2164212.1 DUF2867 domain-containing protein [Pseudodesulfovibrio sp. S3-i]RWU05164.1 DUF2867 domain-containing protein [Pseudodesulfovibrio sp. S3]